MLLGCTSTGPLSGWKQSADQRHLVNTASLPPKSSRSPAQVPIPTFKDVVTLIKDRNAKTIDQALQLLRSTYPDWMSYYTLAYHSRSPQKATYVDPRAIVFGPDARFVLTFNGDPKLAGYGSLETMSFNEEKADYVFQEILFRTEASPETLKDPLVQLTPVGEHIFVSDRNPAKCMDCHGIVNPHPIFENYFNWPGFYGSNDDYLFLQGPGGEHNAFFRGMATPDATSNEADGWKKFSENRGPRYRNLPPMNTSLKDGSTGDVRFRPNNVINLALHEQAVKGIAKTLMSLPNGEALAFAVHTYLTCRQRQVQFLFPKIKGFGDLTEQSLSAQIEAMKIESANAEIENLLLMRKYEPKLIFNTRLGRPPETYLRGLSAEKKELADKVWGLSITPLHVILEKILQLNSKSLDLFALPLQRHFGFVDGNLQIESLRSALLLELKEPLKNYPSQTLDSRGYYGNVTMQECAAMLQEAGERLDAIQ